MAKGNKANSKPGLRVNRPPKEGNNRPKRKQPLTPEQRKSQLDGFLQYVNNVIEEKQKHLIALAKHKEILQGVNNPPGFAEREAELFVKNRSLDSSDQLGLCTLVSGTETSTYQLCAGSVGYISWQAFG
jgi:hypothetical protein